MLFRQNLYCCFETSVPIKAGQCLNSSERQRKVNVTGPKGKNLLHAVSRMFSPITEILAGWGKFVKPGRKSKLEKIKGGFQFSMDKNVCIHQLLPEQTIHRTAGTFSWLFVCTNACKCRFCTCKMDVRLNPVKISNERHCTRGWSSCTPTEKHLFLERIIWIFSYGFSIKSLSELI